MAYTNLLYSLENHIAEITLNRPDLLNSLNKTMRAELADAIRRAGDEGARAALITGAGRAFCAGQDLGEASNRAMPDLGRILRDEYGPIIRAIEEAPIPIISAVNGVAAGAGVSLALLADITIAGEEAEFVVAFSRIGLVPDVGLSHILPRLIGVQRAMGLALFGAPIKGAQAEEWGLIWRAVPDDKLMEDARAAAGLLAAGPTKGHALTRKLIRGGLGDIFAQVEGEADAQREAGASRDFAEGVAAFVERRPPAFEGR